MAGHAANILVVLTLFASGHCFMSTLLDGPLKAAYSVFGNQGGRAAVASPTAYRQMSALAPTVVRNQKQNGAMPNHIVVRPDYNRKPMGDNNKPVGQPLKNGGWNNGDWNNGDWNNGDWNNGDWNNGDWNRGDWNNGDWNIGQSSDSQETDGSWNRNQIKIEKQIGNSYSKHIPMRSSQDGDSWQNEKSWHKINSWQNMKNPDLLQDWVVDSGEVMQGVLVKPASDLVIVAQPAKPISSHGVVFRHSAGSVVARQVFDSL